ncbi:MAG: hypothetical protein QM760_14635 [Nibricoccus sp.]
MTTFSNILLGLATFIYLVPLQFFIRAAANARGEAAMGLIVGFVLTIPLCLLLFISWCIVLSQGGFSWLGGGRGWQLLLLIVTWIAMTVIVSLSAIVRNEPNMPWSLRGLLPWAAYVLPPLAIIATAALNNPSLASVIPANIRQGVLIAVGSITILSGAGSLVEWFIRAQINAANKVREQAEYQDQNIQRIIADIEALDTVRDLGRLFEHAGLNRFEQPREVALKKILAHPNLQQEIERRITNEWTQETLSFLAANDAPNPAALAQPVAVALSQLAAWLNQNLKSDRQFYEGSYLSEVVTALTVADKYARFGVDYRPAILEIRAAFNRSHVIKAGLNAPLVLDQWLARHPASTAVR